MAKKSAKKSPAKQEKKTAKDRPAKVKQKQQPVTEKTKQKTVTAKPTPPVEVKKEAPKVAPKVAPTKPTPPETKKITTTTPTPPPVVEKKEKKKTATPPVKEKKKEAPKKLTLIERIYGTDAPKEVSPFPVSEIQTQTVGLIKQMYIDATRLPQETVDAINSFLVEFTQFANSPNMFNLIPVIQEKDLKAFNLVKAFIDANVALIMENKQIQDNALGNAPQPSIQTPPQPANAPQQQAESTIPPPAPEPVFDNEKYQSDYAKEIESIIRRTFQMAHWGYIPRDVVNQLIDGLDKQFKYEIILAEDGTNSIIKVINGEKIFSTGLINIQ